MEAALESIRQSVEVRHLHGANSPTSLEWWYFTGHLWRTDEKWRCEERADIDARLKERTPDYAVQSTFFLADAEKPKGMLAHAAEGVLAEKIHRSSERAVSFSSDATNHPIGFAIPGILNLTLGNWRLVEVGQRQKHLNWDLRFDVSGTEYLLRLDVPKDKLWFHGKAGYLQKTAETGNFYYSAPSIMTTGQRISRDKSGRKQVERVCGQLWFDHEIHVKKVMDVGWRWFGLNFSEGKSLMLYQIYQQGAFLPARGELFDEKKRTHTQLELVEIQPSDEICLQSKRCYPQSFTIDFFDPTNKTRNRVKTSAWFPEQEVAGRAGAVGRPYWEGGVSALWERQSPSSKSSPQTLKGIGFSELVPKE